LILGGGDVLVAAETGSGKTGAFGVPVLQIVHESLRNAAVARMTRTSASAGTASTDPAPTAASIAMSAIDRDVSLAVSPDGFRVQARGEREWAGCRATIGVTSGKHYFEAVVADDGLVRVGWSTKEGKLDGLGGDVHSWGFGGTGKKSHAGTFSAYGPNGGTAYAKDDVIGCLLDFDGGTIRFTKNGRDVDGAEEAFHFDERKLRAVGMPGKRKNTKAPSASALFPAVCLKNAECVLRFGNARGEAFAYPPPSGYAAIASAFDAQWVPGDADDEEDDEEDEEEGKEKAVSTARTGSREIEPRTPRALVLEPVRELAEQTCAFFQSFSKHLRDPEIRAGLFVGGGSSGADSKKGQAAILQSGLGVDVAVGTPGRILDLVESGILNLQNVRFFVLDEADALLDFGNRGTIAKIRERLPLGSGASGGTSSSSKNRKEARSVAVSFGRVQTSLFSATLRSPSIRRLAEELCHDPTWVDLKGYDHVPDAVRHAVIEVDPEADAASLGTSDDVSIASAIRTDNVHALDDESDAKCARSLRVKRAKLLLLKRVVDALRVERCLIFCRTNFDCELVASFFDSFASPPRKYSSAVLGGALSNDERRRNLQMFKDGVVTFLICTDVAARGVDVRQVPHLINVTLPGAAEEYVHRVGRVGRAGAPGLAISLVSKVPEKVWFCRQRGHKPWVRPTLEDTERHAVWLDEKNILASIEDLHEETLERADASSLESLRESLARFGPGDSGRAESNPDVRGSEATRAAAEIAARLESYAPATRRLARLEFEAQVSFWNLKRKFANQ
jgi:ATP-dependent RNA helicase DDX1